MGCLGRMMITLVVIGALSVAGYLLVVKPIVDETTNTINRAFEGNQPLIERIERSLDAAGVGGLDISLDSPGEARRLLTCIERARGDPRALERCGRRHE